MAVDLRADAGPRVHEDYRERHVRIERRAFDLVRVAGVLEVVERDDRPARELGRLVDRVVGHRRLLSR